VLTTGEWSVEYNPRFVKTTSKPLKPSTVFEQQLQLPGELLPTTSPMLGFLARLGQAAEWHLKDKLAIQVAKHGRSFRTPVPRHSATMFPTRTTYGMFRDKETSHWRKLEERASYMDLPNPQGTFGRRAEIIVTIFHPA
jgi:hypothetical protein